MNDLKDKRALVTGGSRGIGAGIALALAEARADVAITFEKSAERAAEVVARIEGLGCRAVAVQADSADPAAVKRSVDEAAERLGGLDILVNNAGIGRAGPVSEIPLADLDALLNVNVRAVVLASQAALTHLPDGGRIVSIGSTLAERVPFGGVTVYSMTKSALVAFNKGLARELGPRGITVNLVHPGSTDTDANPAAGPNAAGQLGLSALGRFGKPEDIGKAVVFLAGPWARQITGSAVTVDGGANA
jgi:NAD(P)-dependent dehydrogenase (short-subunit alcohol dehydrogenase family)